MKSISTSTGLTVVIPAYNEGDAIAGTLSALRQALTSLPSPHEIIVVDDGSSDATAANASSAGARVIRHPTNGGYGRSLLTGIEAAQYDTVAIVDADGTYPVEELPALIAFYDQGFQMVVGARQGRYYHSSFTKSLLRSLFRFLSEFTCGRDIPDINSGFRIFDRRPVLQWRDSMSTGFSFTTTITLLFMLNNLMVGYRPIPYRQRTGNSKVRLFRDSLRSLQIIVTTIAQFNPLKLFLLLGGLNFIGNLIIFLSTVQMEWPMPHAFFFAMMWNILCVIASFAIVAMGLLKPAGAHSRWHPAP